jgi:lipopolysaccharide biosynthesis glycosyltransferase
MNPMHLAVAFDQNYTRHFYALAASIFDNNRANRIVFHCIFTGLSDRQKENIRKYLERNNSEVRYYEVDEAFVSRFVLTSNWTPAAYYRLFFPALVGQDVGKLLYLDTDTIVVDDLAPLFCCDLEGYPVGAVEDNLVKTAPQLGILEEGNYFNSGMMLMNIPVWKEQRVSEQVFEYISKYPERINYVDQCGLNAVLINRWKKLDWRFNVIHSRIPEAMTKRQRNEFLKNKVIFHFTRDRPWNMLCRNPYRDLYHKYLLQSPFQGKVYEDYSIMKTPQFLKIKATEMYFELPLVQRIWRRIKH